MTFSKILPDVLLKMNQSSSRFGIIWRKNQWQKTQLGFTISAKINCIVIHHQKAILIAGVLVHQQIVKIKAVLVIVIHHPHLLQQHRLYRIRGKKDFEGKRSSEASLKLAAISRSFVTVAESGIICSANCSVNGNCLKTLNMLDFLDRQALVVEIMYWAFPPRRRTLLSARLKQGCKIRYSKIFTIGTKTLFTIFSNTYIMQVNL